MRYHFKRPKEYSTLYGRTYHCNHPVYDSCTLFEIGGKGLAVIQQRFSRVRKRTWWTEIDPWMVDTLYLHPKFLQFFEERSGPCEAGLYPTVSLRQIMWGLKMKPIKRQRWETLFDRRLI